MRAGVVGMWAIFLVSVALTLGAFTGHVPLLLALPGILIFAAMVIGLVVRRGSTPGPGP